MKMRVRNIEFLDSYEFLHFALAAFPKALGFKGGKGTFPHLFNKLENWDYVGELPEPAYYGVDEMMPQKQAEFYKWLVVLYYL